ncbi:MAG: anti-sigma factor [Anaerolineales bacterium]
MSDERCLPYRENLAAYALGTLDADDIRALESHLENCQDCQSELADYQSVTTGLLHSVPPQAPPPSLRRKLVAQLPSQRTQTPNLRPNIFSRFSLGQVATTVIVVILLGLNIFSSMQIRELQQQQAELTERLSNEQVAIAMLAYPSTQSLTVSADVQNLAGSMLVDREKRIAVLVLWNLPPLDAGQTYQAWLIDADGNRVSGGLFASVIERGYTTATIHSPAPIGEFEGLGVTVEPSGGSEGPTGPRVLAVDL